MKSADRCPQHPLAVFGVLPALKGGLLDSLTPGSMAAWLILAALLVLINRRNKHMVQYAALIITGVFVLRIMIVSSALDFFILSKGLDVFLEIWYFIFSIVCLALGCIFWHDWWVGKRNGKVWVTADFFFGPLNSPNDGACVSPKGHWLKAFLRYLLAAVLALLTGGGLALLASAWAENAVFVTTVLSLMSAYNMPGLFLVLCVYSFMYVLPLFLVLILSILGLKKKRSADYLRSHFSLVQIVIAAVFLGYGIAFISYYP